MLILWPKIVRVLSVLYDNKTRTFSSEDKLLPILQVLYCLVILALAAFDVWIVTPTNGNLIRFTYQSGAKSDTDDLSPKLHKLLAGFFHLSNILVAWIVFTQMSVIKIAE